MLFNLSAHDSIAQRFLLELRSKEMHHDRMRFRRSLERLGEILSYEISKTMTYRSVSIRTPLAETMVRDIVHDPVLITILRAGIPFMEGFLNFFDSADAGFVGAYRVEEKRGVKIMMEYISTPEIKDREVIVIDPMLATGHSLRKALEELLKNQRPSKLHIASVICAPEGLRTIQDFLESQVKLPYAIWTCAIDEKLDENYYIVPGLGDAGDLSFGAKI